MRVNRSGSRFAKIVLSSGHMIDKPDRGEERFPPRKEAPVRECIARKLEEWGIGAGDLGVCGGARGGDILFAELCAERGAEVWLFLPLALPEFLEESVRLPDSDWEDRFFELKGRPGVKTFFQTDSPEAPPEGTSVFAHNNLSMINTGRVEADDPGHLYAILVWDERPGGDGPGGTADFALRIKKLGGHLAIVNPTKL